MLPVLAQLDGRDGLQELPQAHCHGILEHRELMLKDCT